jgi:hypothetical protein
VHAESNGQPFTEIREDLVANNVFQTTIPTDEHVDDIIDSIDSFNVLSKKNLGCKVFVNDAKTLAGLKGSVKNKEEFNMKIASLASIIATLGLYSCLE